jgi:hypothetical protein
MPERQSWRNMWRVPEKTEPADLPMGLISWFTATVAKGTRPMHRELVLLGIECAQIERLKSWGTDVDYPPKASELMRRSECRDGPLAVIKRASRLFSSLLSA